MAISKKIEKVLNKQINAELWSAYFYLSMSAYFYKTGLPGFANWMKIQYHEENQHGMRIFNYLNDRGGEVLLIPIDEVPTDWDGVLHVFQETLKHEIKVTHMINECMGMAIEEQDHATVSMLKWFVDEQVEEEATASEIIDQLKLFDGKGPGLFHMDKALAARTLGPEN